MISDLKLLTHEAVAYVLIRENRGMSAVELADIIREEKLSITERRLPPTSTEINRRIKGETYRDAFIVKNGLIYHRPVEDMRLMRLTYNTKGWTSPVAHKWSVANRKRDKAFENQYGFGFEEWLMNEVFFQDGYQYGLIRGAEDIKNIYQSVQHVYLYTINQATKERFLVGEVRELELISAFSPKRGIAEAIFARNRDMMERDIKAVGGDALGLDTFINYPPVRFQLENIRFFEHWIPAPELATTKFRRFQPYHLKNGLDEILNKKIPVDFFLFRAGRAKRGGSRERTMTGGVLKVEDLHVQIVDELELFLMSADSPFGGDVGIENCKFGWNTADAVIEQNKGAIQVYSIFEVKTSRNIKRNIREALGQLLDYACWYASMRVERLVIISPEKMNDYDQQYFDRIRKSLSYELQYWQYDKDTKKFLI